MFKFQVGICNPIAVYHDGDQVKGAVLLESPDDETVLSVKVRFSGVATTELSRKKIRVVYFETERQLYTGHYTLRRGRYEWTFDFRFPTTVSPVLELASSYAQRGVSLPQCPLPPSVVTVPDIAFGNDAQLEYALDAVVERVLPESPDYPVSTYARKTLTYRPLRLEQGINVGYTEWVRPLFVHSLKLNQRYIEKGLLSTDRAKVWLRGAKGSIASWDIKLFAPVVLVLGQPIAVMMSIRENPEKSTCSTIPTVRIESWDGFLDVVTQISSVPSIPTQSGRNSPRDGVYDIGTLKLDHLYKIQAVKIVSELDHRGILSSDGSPLVIGHIFGGAKDPKEILQPSFEAVTIAQKSELRISVRFVCAGKTVEVQWSKIPITIVSGAARALAQVQNDLMAPAVAHIDEPPPAYHAVATQS